MAELIKEVKRLFNKYFLRKPNVQRITLGVVTYVLTLLVLLLSVVPTQVDLNVGQASTRNIYAPITFEDEIATEKARVQAEQQVPDQHSRDRNLEMKASENLESIQSLIIEYKQSSAKEIKAQLAQQLSNKIYQNLQISDKTLDYIRRLDKEELTSLNDKAAIILQEVYDEGIIKTVESGIVLIKHKITELKRNITEELYLESIISAVYQPSMSYSEVLTLQLKKEARANVAPVLIHKGDVIVIKGQVITEQIYIYLEKSGLLSTGRRTQMIIGVAIFLLIVFILIVSLIKFFCKNIFSKVVNLLMYAIILFLSVVFTAFLVRVSPLIVFSVTVGVLITVLLDWQGAIIAVFAYNAIISPMIIDSPYLIISSILAGIAAIASSYKMSQRADMIRIALYVAGVSGLTVVASNLIKGAEIGLIANSAFIAVLNSIAMVILAIGSLPLLENSFGIISTVRLLELSNPNRPLLRKLLLEAPGTYNHSIVLGNLAEAAAEAIGADPLLARVGAFYHDIGKLKRPGFFVENQLDGTNPHDKYTPSLSALVIMSHVKDGVELAQEEKLPEQVIDMIKQHHGTTLVSYFYHKAKEQNEGEDDIRESEYRYDGPRPQTKEAGIIMLSDAIEAAVRSLKRRSPAKVEEVVRKIIKSRLQDGELDECDLTMRDLEKLAETYIRVLSGVYHNRIAYPERSIADLERSKKIGRGSNTK